MLYASPPLQKRIQTLLRKKIAAGQVARQLLTSSIRMHAAALHEYFVALLALADAWLRESAAAVQGFGAALYLALYAAYGAYQRQVRLPDQQARWARCLHGGPRRLT